MGRALRPIDHIVTEAEALTADRLGAALLSRRALSDDEIGHLVTALNSMLARLSRPSPASGSSPPTPPTSCGLR